eukprot:276646_1
MTSMVVPRYSARTLCCFRITRRRFATAANLFSDPTQKSTSSSAPSAHLSVPEIRARLHSMSAAMRADRRANFGRLMEDAAAMEEQWCRTGSQKKREMIGIRPWELIFSPPSTFGQKSIDFTLRHRSLRRLVDKGPREQCTPTMLYQIMKDFCKGPDTAMSLFKEFPGAVSDRTIDIFLKKALELGEESLSEPSTPGGLSVVEVLQFLAGNHPESLGLNTAAMLSFFMFCQAEREAKLALSTNILYGLSQQSGAVLKKVLARQAVPIDFLGDAKNDDMAEIRSRFLSSVRDSPTFSPRLPAVLEQWRAAGVRVDQCEYAAAWMSAKRLDEAERVRRVYVAEHGARALVHRHVLRHARKCVTAGNFEYFLNSLDDLSESKKRQSRELVNLMLICVCDHNDSNLVRRWTAGMRANGYQISIRAAMRLVKWSVAVGDPAEARAWLHGGACSFVKSAPLLVDVLRPVADLEGRAERRAFAENLLRPSTAVLPPKVTNFLTLCKERETCAEISNEYYRTNVAMRSKKVRHQNGHL